jgi:hypothetical protein
MKKTIAVAIAAVSMFALAADASAWARSGSTTAYGGSCTHTGSVTGPHDNAINHTGV